jgi:hypothetical protein
MRTPKDALRPIEIVVAGILVGLTLLAASAVFGQIVLSTASFNTPGVRDLDPVACVSVPNDGTLVTGIDPTHTPSSPDVLVKRDAFSEIDRVSVCQGNATIVARLEALSYRLMDRIVLVIVCALVLRLVWTARRRGLLTRSTARMTRSLGLALIACAVVGPLVAACLRWLFLRHVVTGADLGHSLLHPGFLWTAIVVGMGIITFARILRVAVQLQEEAELTV